MLSKLCIAGAIISSALLSGSVMISTDYNNSMVNVSETMYKSSLPCTSEISYLSSFEPVSSPEYDDAQFPQKYDLRDYGIVTPVRSQGDYGTCWAVCATESLETHILKNNYESDIDLSEWHLAYFTFANNGVVSSLADNIFRNGGNNTSAVASLSKWVGAAYEERAPYDSSQTLDESIKFTSDYLVQDAYNVRPWLSSNKSYSVPFIKKLVYDKNAISVFYNSSRDYYNPDTYSQCCLETGKQVSHAVLVVGWDDNYPKENFLEQNRPENNGAWLIKNSWGEEWGDEGYFWLSYEDRSLCEAVCYFCEPKGTYTNNYYYDDYGWVTSIAADSAQQSLTGYMANIFTAEKNEKITAVSFYTSEPSAEYEISVYSDLKSSYSPVNGTKHPSTSGSEEYFGYHTVKLDTPVQISEGTKFSVVVKITNHKSPYTIPVDASVITTIDGSLYRNIDSLSLLNNSLSKQSFVSADGAKWTDVASKSYTYKYPEYLFLAAKSYKINQTIIGNVCVKAFSSSAEQSTLTGDLNLDSRIDMEDVIIMQRHLFGTNLSDTEFCEENADKNCDDTINILDIILLKKMIVS